MTTKTTLFLLGVCVGVALPLLARAVRPLGVYALAGGMIAFEAVCDMFENTADAMSASMRKARHVADGPADNECSQPALSRALNFR